MNIKKPLYALTMAAAVIANVFMGSQGTVVKAATQSVIVCDDSSCWKVDATVADNISVYEGNTKMLTVSATKLDGIQIQYKTSNPSVATVSSNGKIKGIKKGTATITVTLGGSHVQKETTFQTKVKVKKASISIQTPAKSVKVKKSITLKVKKKGINKKAFWSVNTPSIASIGKTSGKLKAKKKGKVKVTVICGNLKKSITITVV